MRRTLTAVLVVLVAPGMVMARPACAQRAVAVTLLDTAEIAAPLLTESSGVTASRRKPGILWTHNDSGDGPWLYTTDSTGADLGRIRVQGAGAVDWEDISFGACTRSSGNCLFIGDIGDNNARRPWVTIYVVPEPEPPAASSDTLRVAAAEDTIVLRYPDRPHDAEALAIVGGWIYVITKDRLGPPILFRSPARVSGARVLTPVATLPIATGLLRGRLVTGAALSPDGRILAVRTYVSLHFFAVNDGVPLPLTDRDGVVIPVIEAQGEGVCFDERGRLVLTGERGRGRHAIVARLLVSGLDGP
jgi:hypothetical protein